jgi:hypothetical protein
MADKDLRKADATSILIPLKMPVGDRSYKVLVNQQDIPFIASSKCDCCQVHIFDSLNYNDFQRTW